jgi:hypothetical protein
MSQFVYWLGLAYLPQLRYRVQSLPTERHRNLTWEHPHL